MTAAMRNRLLAAAFGCAAALAVAAPQAVATPPIATYGQAISADLRDSMPVHLPGTRYWRNGNTITVDYDYDSKLFSPWGPDYGSMPVPLGELAAGNYTLEARVFDIARPGSGPTVTTANLPIVPPQKWGLYPVPQFPRAYDNVQLTVRSAAYFDPSKLSASANGYTIRVDMNYFAGTKGTTVPASYTTFASVSVGALPPGQYHVEGWAVPDTGGESQKQFTLDFAVDSSVRVIEYYAPQTGHYFVTASPDEVALLDAGGQGGWRRTGQRINAWMRVGDAPPSAQPVCRFYAAGPNSHFYTGDAAECQQLRQIEQAGRANATASGKPFLGWAYEGIAFYALLPQNGQCAAGTTTVYRAYNGRAAQNDTNHRFTVDFQLRNAMLVNWMDEGAAFCSPS